MKSFIISLIIACILVSNVFGAVGGKRVLIIVDDLSMVKSHSQFFSTLEGKGYKIEYHSAGDKVELEKYGDFFYDHLILFAPTSDSLSITSSDVLKFIDGGNNVFIAASNGVISDTVRDIATECGIEIEDDKTSVFDHFNYDKQQSEQNLIVADQYIQDAPIILQGLQTPVLFKGVGHSIRQNPLNYAVLTGSSTAYSRKASGVATKLMGKKVGLVSSLQARNNARVTFAGSIDMFSNKFFTSKLGKDTVGNREFAESLLSWTLQERGILRSSNLSIKKISTESNSTVAPEILTIKDEIEYSITVEEFVKDQWVPYVGQLELEIIMLDPYIRTFIKGNKDGEYKSIIKLPDVYGVFTFEATIQKPGYGNLDTFVRQPIRPFRHDSYERFIPSAFPYYAACFSMIVGVFVFSIVFLFHQEPKKAL
ncbi:hypothetical protein CYY_006687 [Polysphondylium violaceum]|uniref:Dolichyl-diphosphooligosaccharide--protein glycosyltransferase 48 kDa subunit n=1 Tax=Polysphondylium violaceum TaxID=133409 RepID=A0A8J4UYT5_9MYCE|nr:hypothetical protein CYY_006687 [Polysphondylium violaceum]